MSSPPKLASPWAVKLVHQGKNLGLPVGLIRQKLVLEGLEPTLINSVLSSSDYMGADEEHIEPSSPPTSPQRRQLSARKFNDMLQVGVPPSAVRQKMAMEGCAPEDINSFFATKASPEKAQAAA